MSIKLLQGAIVFYYSQVGRAGDIGQSGLRSNQNSQLDNMVNVLRFQPNLTFCHA